MHRLRRIAHSRNKDIYSKPSTFEIQTGVTQPSTTCVNGEGHENTIYRGSEIIWKTGSPKTLLAPANQAHYQRFTAVSTGKHLRPLIENIVGIYFEM